jgi:hypothetical protein
MKLLGKKSVVFAQQCRRSSVEQHGADRRGKRKFYSGEII